jgi:phosphoglycolate phosphatase
MPPQAVLFDLDGTLVQTRAASWNLFARINAELDLGISTQQHFFRLMEDNLFHALRRQLGDESRAEEAGRRFLALLQSEYEPELVPGMSDVVKAFAGKCSLAVISSNSVATIRRILSKANLAHCFSHVFGGDVEPDKRAAVNRFLADRSYLVNRDCMPAYRESDQPLETMASRVVLITDTVGDVRHGRECGIRTVGVAWGMHTEEQLLAAGAEFVAIWPQELVALLLPDGFAAACGVETPSTLGSCGCQSGGGGGAACGCRDNDIAEANEIRRRRSIAAATLMTGALSAPEGGSPVPISSAPLSAPAKIDAALLKSLARLRAGLASSSDRAAHAA